MVPILDKFREKHFGVCIYFSPNLANFHPVTTFATARERWAHDDVIKWKHFPRYCPLCGEFTGKFPSQKPVTRSFDMFFDLRLNKRLSNQRSGWSFETPLCSLWRHCNRISEKFNDFFVNIGPTLARTFEKIKGSPEQYLEDRRLNSLFLKPVTTEEVGNIMASLKDSSPGHDEMKIGPIRSVLNYIEGPLTYVCNLSLNEGIFPDILKLLM